MLEKIQDLPPHVFGVRAANEVSGADLKNVLLPGLEDLTSRHGEIYYLLVLNTAVKNFTAAAWFQDMLAGIKHFSRWKKMAIVTDEKAVRNFTDMASKVMPGEAKGFTHAEVGTAVAWLSERNTESATQKFPIKKLALTAIGVLLAASLLKKGISLFKRKHHH